jgi:hypothetical protein
MAAELRRPRPTPGTRIPDETTAEQVRDSFSALQNGIRRADTTPHHRKDTTL